MDGARLKEFNRACQLNDTVLRQLVLKVDERLADALVSHARGEAPTDGEVAVAVDEAG